MTIYSAACPIGMIASNQIIISYCTRTATKLIIDSTTQSCKFIHAGPIPYDLIVYNIDICVILRHTGYASAQIIGSISRNKIAPYPWRGIDAADPPACSPVGIGINPCIIPPYLVIYNIRSGNIIRADTKYPAPAVPCHITCDQTMADGGRGVPT